MARGRKIPKSVTDWNIKISQYVKYLRDTNNYNQDDFAEIIGLERSTYARRELGKGKFLAAEVVCLIQYIRKFGKKDASDPEELLKTFLQLSDK